jgi:hypothetical protein
MMVCIEIYLVSILRSHALDPEDDSPCYFGDYVYARVVSNYPMKATMQSDRYEIRIHFISSFSNHFLTCQQRRAGSLSAHGRPCVRPVLYRKVCRHRPSLASLPRYASATVFALGDGCNWGMKPRMAANRATRAYAVFFLSFFVADVSGL